MNIYDCWKFSVKREIIYSKGYTKALDEELIMFVVFKYDRPLMLKLIELASTRGELVKVVDLMQMPWGVEVTRNGNLRVFNT